MVLDPKTILASRLKQARTIRKYSLRDLAEAMGGSISHSALAKYEQGEMMPGTNILIQLADSLEQSPDFFFRPFTIHLEKIRFLKQVKLSVKEEASIREQAADYFERYHEIEQFLGEHRNFPGKLNVPPVKKIVDADMAAEKLREEWSLGCEPLGSVGGLLETRGIKVAEAPPSSSFEALAVETNAGPMVIISKNLKPIRQRMALAHELGHLILPIHLTSPKKEEAIIHQFALSLLLPRASFLAEIGRSRNAVSETELIAIKLKFGASISMIMERAWQLGAISAAFYERFQSGEHAWRQGDDEPGNADYAAPQLTDRFRQLTLRALAEGIISLSKAAALLNENQGTIRKELKPVFI